MNQQFKYDIEALSKTNIFFGHQSVGFNILSGISDLLLGCNVDSKIVQIKELDDFQEDFIGTIVHQKIGENRNPFSKFEDFRNLIDQKLNGHIDYALMKLCYIDVNRDSDIQQILSEYKKTIAGLRLSFPELTVIHATVPLRLNMTGPGVWLRELAGKLNLNKMDNIRRNQLNQLIRQEYSSEPLLDIALYESTDINGKKAVFKSEGVRYEYLLDQYTNDGGHLNVRGRKYLAHRCINCLAEIVRST